MEYQVHFGKSAFAVPGAVVDHYLRLAGEIPLKVLLYLLRQSGSSPSPAQIAAALRCKEEQVAEALQFWIQAGVLDSAEDPAPAAGFAFAAPPAQAAAEPVRPAAAVQRSSKEIKLDPSEISGMLQTSASLMDLFTMAESCVGRPLNHMEQRSLVWLHSYLNLPAEVILMLVTYALDIGKYSMSYVEAIAIRWEQEGIVSLSQAEEEIARMRRTHTFVDDVRKLFEMKRNPTTQQMAFIEKWMAAGVSMELLHYAYETTIENTDKLSFRYLDKILENCAAAGASTPEEARNLKAPTRQSFRRNAAQPMTAQEIEEMNDYLSVVDRFQEDEE